MSKLVIVMDSENLDLKETIKRLVDEQHSMSCLESIKKTLEEDKAEQEAIKQDMIASALRSKEDINAGRLLTRKQLEASLNASLGT